MATMYLSIERFNLRSSWTTTWDAARGANRHSIPTTDQAIKIFGASALPAGSTVQAAILTVDASTGYTGGTLTMDGSTAVSQDVTALFQASQDGAFADFGITFTYKAYGGAGDAGAHLSVCVVKSTTIEITYTVGGGAAFDAAAYRAAALADSRAIRPRGIIRYADGATQPITADNIIGFEINEGCANGVLMGAATSAMLEMTLANAGGEWLPGGALRGSRALYGAKITLEIGLQVDGAYIYTPAGTYVIDEIRGREGDPALSISGYDTMCSELQKPFVDDLSYPATLSQILAKIIERAGIGVTGVLAANRVVTITKRPDWGEKCTIRSALAYVCAAGASYAYITRGGLIGIADAWALSPALALTTSHYTSLMHDERELIFNRIVVTPRGAKKAEDNLFSTIDASIGELPSNSLYIDDNPLFVKGEASAQTLADGVKTALTGASWHALDVTWRGDPSVTIGTRVTVTDRTGAQRETTIMAQSIVWDAGFAMTAACTIDTHENIRASAVTGGGMIDSKKISLEAIDAGRLATGAVTEDKIDANAVTTDKIADGVITADKIAAQTITAESSIIADAAITRAKIGEAAIGAAQIEDAAVTRAKIGEAAIGSAQMGDAAITQAKIADAAIGTAKIRDAAITKAKIGSAAVGTANIEIGAITTALIGTGAVETAQIADGSITDAKIVSLTANKLTAGTIDAGDINVINLNAENLTVGKINGQQIADGAITTENLAQGAITSEKISYGCITDAAIAEGAVTADKIALGAIVAQKLNLSKHLLV